MAKNKLLIQYRIQRKILEGAIIKHPKHFNQTTLKEFDENVKELYNFVIENKLENSVYFTIEEDPKKLYKYKTLNESKELILEATGRGLEEQTTAIDGLLQFLTNEMQSFSQGKNLKNINGGLNRALQECRAIKQSIGDVEGSKFMGLGQRSFSRLGAGSTVDRGTSIAPDARTRMSESRTLRSMLLEADPVMSGIGSIQDVIKGALQTDPNGTAILPQNAIQQIAKQFNISPSDVADATHALGANVPKKMGSLAGFKNWLGSGPNPAPAPGAPPSIPSPGPVTAPPADGGGGLFGAMTSPTGLAVGTAVAAGAALKSVHSLAARALRIQNLNNFCMAFDKFVDNGSNYAQENFMDSKGALKEGIENLLEFILEAEPAVAPVGKPGEVGKPDETTSGPSKTAEIPPANMKAIMFEGVNLEHFSKISSRAAGAGGFFKRLVASGASKEIPGINPDSAARELSLLVGKEMFGGKEMFAKVFFGAVKANPPVAAVSAAIKDSAAELTAAEAQAKAQQGAAGAAGAVPQNQQGYTLSHNGKNMTTQQTMNRMAGAQAGRRPAMDAGELPAPDKEPMELMRENKFRKTIRKIILQELSKKSKK